MWEADRANLAMIVPTLVKIDFTALGQVRAHWRCIGVTLFINWAIKPLSMRRSTGCSSVISSGTIYPRRSSTLILQA